MAQLHDLIFPSPVRARPRLETLAVSPPRARASHANPASPQCRRKCVVAENSSTCVASPQAVSKRGGARSSVAPVAHVAPGSPSGVGGCGVKTQRHLLTWRQGARWRRQMWRQNVASGIQVASPDVASKRGVTYPCGIRGRHQMWRQNVASLAHVASGIQVASPDVSLNCCVKTWCHLTTPSLRARCVTRCGFKLWRDLPTWRQAARWHRWICTRVHANGLTWCHRTRRQNVASLAHVVFKESRGIAGRGVSTWRQALSTYAASHDVATIHGVRRPTPPSSCLQYVLSVVRRYVHPTSDRPVIVLYYAMLYYVMLYDTLLCSTLLYCTVLHYT